jgi:hypothetical protein
MALSVAEHACVSRMSRGAPTRLLSGGYTMRSGFRLTVALAIPRSSRSPFRRGETKLAMPTSLARERIHQRLEMDGGQIRRLVGDGNHDVVCAMASGPCPDRASATGLSPT